MADFDLTQSGQEIQNILDGAAMQTDLTAEIERAEQAEQQLQGNIDIEETRAKAAEKQNADDIDVIEGKIPAAASSENQLADKNFVNSSIATNTATYRGAFNLVSDLHLTIDATEQQIAAALAGAISTADNNDYSFVQVPTADATPTQIAAIERYKFNGTAWAYEYTLNNSGFTADQWAALNSGITTGLVAKLAVLPTNDELTLLLGGKQDVLTFDNVPTEGSNNPVKSGGVKSAIDSEKERAQGAEQANAGNIAQVIAMIPAAASSENQLADKNFVNSSIATNTATYRGAYNEVSDLSLTVDATHEQIAAALAGAISTADNNDYCFVQVPTADATPTQIAAIERYKFNGTAWAYEYTLNNSGFTANQWAAINSGITSGLVAKLSALPTNDDLVAALAGKQPMLTFDNVPTDNSTNPVKSGGVYAAIAEEAGTRAAAIAAIVALIPSAASALNQLADKAFVNSSISTATAVFKGTFNVVADLELNYNASQAQIALMLGSKIASADNNDYCFVQIPTSNETPLEIARTDRYKYNGTAWAYEYTLNNSGFTAAQWAAINSGITSLLKDKLIDLPTATELATQLAAKQNTLTFDTTPTEGSTNPVTSNGIHTAINVEKERAEAAEEALDTNKADKATTLAGYGITDAYNKTEVNNLVSTPNQNYVTVATYASLPASGSTDTIYRVSSYDGANNQIDDTVYSEYAWDGTQYIFLDVKSQIDEVFDITVYNSNTKYADLAAALGVDGANIPATLRRGGMSVKFVHSSDNKYIQYRYMSSSTASADFTNAANWQGIDEVPIASSNNLVKSGGVFSRFGYNETFQIDVPADSYATRLEGVFGRSLRIIINDFGLLGDSEIIRIWYFLEGEEYASHYIVVLKGKNEYEIENASNIVTLQFQGVSLSNSVTINYSVFTAIEKEICQLNKSVDRLENKVEKTENVDFSSVDTVNGWIGSDGVFHSNNQASTAYIDVSGANKIEVTANPVNNATIAFTKSPMFADLQSLDLCDGEIGSHIIAPNVTKELNVPSDAKYVIVYKEGWEDNYAPSSMTIYKNRWSNLESLPMYGKKVAFLGDSITLASADKYKGFVVRASEILGYIPTNAGTSGASTEVIENRPSLVNLIENVSLDNDYLVIQPSIVNDSIYNAGELSDSFIPEGSAEYYDTTTYYGALEYLARYATKRFKKVGFLIHYKLTEVYNNRYNIEMPQIIRNVCAKWGIPLLDLSNYAGFNLVSEDLRVLYGNYVGNIPAYNPESSYALDEQAKYEGSVYKANQAISAPAGAFDSSKWTQIASGSSDYDSAHCNTAGYILMTNKIVEFLKSL